MKSLSSDVPSSLKCSLIEMRSFTSGVPEVKVPVLSKTIVVILEIFSNTSPPLINTPNDAAIPVPTITAVGVASPRAHGQAMTRVEIPKLNANSNCDSDPKSNFYPASEYVIENHMIHVIIVSNTTNGTKY